MASYKIWLLIIMLMFSMLAIAPWGFFKSGVEIKSIEKNSTEASSGLKTGMVITEINSNWIKNLDDYSKVVAELFPNAGEQTKTIIKTDKGTFIFLKNSTLGITVSEISKTKLKTGLDLSGGARALIKPANLSLSQTELKDLISITSERFNVYGLKDITIKPVKDLQGENYMLIEIAGATPEDLESLVSNQGKFEGKIGNATVFIGGEDISHVERSGQYSGIEGCYDTQEGALCRFRFSISLTEEAARKHAEATSKLGLNPENPSYLSEKLDLYLDDSLTDSLFISKDLKGEVTTQIMVQGSGIGSSKQEALEAAKHDMNKLQTILITGSLPFKLEIVKLDTLSPALGKEFTKNISLLGLIAFVLVSAILFIKYRKVKITLAVILTMFSEAFITLGIATLIKWNLDASSIAGIIAGMGTGVDDQIVILDESSFERTTSIKERIKKAFFIILGAFFATVVAMIPLFWAGAGMLKGFALTTIITISAGVLVTRPAFAEIIKKLVE